jgi:hypothetical protein
MPTQEFRRVANQGHARIVPEADRLFAEALRRLLLRVVAMIEDRYELRPVNAERRSVTTR